jgi:hypothetical protein
MIKRLTCQSVRTGLSTALDIVTGVPAFKSLRAALAMGHDVTFPPKRPAAFASVYSA